MKNITTPSECVELLNAMELNDQIPKSIHTVLHNLISDQYGPKYEFDQNNEYKHVQNIIVGSNRILLEEAKHTAKQLGHVPFILTSTLGGSAAAAGKIIAAMSLRLCQLYNHNKTDLSWASFVHYTQAEFEALYVVGINFEGLFEAVEASFIHNQALCIVSAGETVVNVIGTGVGGRNRELALSAAMFWHQQSKEELSGFDIQLLSMATDGQDGPFLGGASGAIVDPLVVDRSLREGIDPQSYLDNNDSGTFFDNFADGSAAVFTGLTGTNVMDLQLLLIRQTSLHRPGS